LDHISLLILLFYPIATGEIWRAEIMEEGEQEVGVEKEEMEAAVG